MVSGVSMLRILPTLRLGENAEKKLNKTRMETEKNSRIITLRSFIALGAGVT